MEDQSANPTQVVARLLRHEIGDLLQAVYATVAVLLDRLPSGGQERQLLGSLKQRAEMCRLELDAVVDLVCSLPGPVREVDLGRLVTTALAQIRPRYESLIMEEHPGPALPVRADGRLVAGAILFLFLAVAQHARRSVVVRLERADGLVRVRIHRDGVGVSDEPQRWIDQPFSTTKQSTFGLALALVQRALAPGLGCVTVSNQSGGVEVLLESPIAPSSDG